MKAIGGLLVYTLVTALYIGEAFSQEKKPPPKNHCLGVTKKTGDSCRTIPKEGRYCRWHDPNAIHCAKQNCGMLVAKKGDYCIYHLK